MGDWQQARLERLVRFKTGKLDSNAAVSDGAYPFFTCSQETLRTNSFSFDTECVLLAGNNANGIYPLKYFHGKFDAYQRTYVLVPQDTNVLLTRFLYYALRPKLSEFRSFSTGAATKFLTLTILNATEIPLPSPAVQRRIVGILSAYDNLIENCERRIRVLDEMARAVYREWFVLFRYPGHEKTPLVDSPLGRIPKGWRPDVLGAVASINAEQVDLKRPPERIRYIDISSVSPGTVENITEYDFLDAPGRARRIVHHGDVLWSCVRPNRRSHALVLHPAKATIASTGFAVLTAKELPYSYIYAATTTDEFVSYLEKRATGAAYPAVTAKVFEDAPVLVPEATLLERFAEIANPCAETIASLRFRIENLRKTRDLLLPRLLSGQLSVEDAA
jgi:type I restriction enzyme S subunit